MPMGPGRVAMAGAESGLPEVRDVLAAIDRTI
jgi:hypothetical protein